MHSMGALSLLINLIIIIIINPAPRLNYAAKEWENFKDSENIFYRVNIFLCSRNQFKTWQLASPVLLYSLLFNIPKFLEHRAMCPREFIRSDNRQHLSNIEYVWCFRLHSYKVQSDFNSDFQREMKNSLNPCNLDRFEVQMTCQVI